MNMTQYSITSPHLSKEGKGDFLYEYAGFFRRGEGDRTVGFFFGESEAGRNDERSRAKVSFQFWEERVEHFREEIGIDDIRIRVSNGEEIFFPEGDRLRMTVPKEIPPRETIRDDIFFDADILRAWFAFMAFDEHTRITATEFVEGDSFFERDGVDDVAQYLRLCGDERGFAEEHSDELYRDNADDASEESCCQEEYGKERKGHDGNSYICRSAGNRTRVIRTRSARNTTIPHSVLVVRREISILKFQFPNKLQ